MTTTSSVLVTGASGSLGSRLLLNLADSDYKLTGLGRKKCPTLLHSKCDWLSHDLNKQQDIKHTADVLIHCAPLWLLPELLNHLIQNGRLKRCIAMSSTSVIAKMDAQDDEDRILAARLTQAEDDVTQLSSDKINTTILRPTLIYGYGEDKNISVITAFIKKFGFFPVAGKANGLRQPVHVDDLVTAIIEILANPRTFGKTYSLTGSQTMSYKAMLEKIFLSLDKPARILHLPLPVYRLLLRVRNNGYSPGSANRMNQNLSYDIKAAVSDFNYQPQGFLQHPEKDLI